MYIRTYRHERTSTCVEKHKYTVFVSTNYTQQHVHTETCITHTLHTYTCQAISDGWHCLKVISQWHPLDTLYSTCLPEKF